MYLSVYVCLSLFLQDAWIPTALYQSTFQVRIKGTSCTRDVSTNWQEFPESYRLTLDSRPVCLPASCLSQALWTTSFCVEILLQSGFMVKADNGYLRVPTHSWFLSYIPVSHPVPSLNFILSHWSVGLIHPSTYYNNHSCNLPPFHVVITMIIIANAIISKETRKTLAFRHIIFLAWHPCQVSVFMRIWPEALQEIEFIRFLFLCVCTCIRMCSCVHTYLFVLSWNRTCFFSPRRIQQRFSWQIWFQPYVLSVPELGYYKGSRSKHYSLRIFSCLDPLFVYFLTQMWLHGYSYEPEAMECLGESGLSQSNRRTT